MGHVITRLQEPSVTISSTLESVEDKNDWIFAYLETC